MPAVFHCVYVPLLYPFVCRWTSRLLCDDLEGWDGEGRRLKRERIYIFITDYLYNYDCD